MIILGIGGILGNAACAILRDGELVAAVERAKLTRRAGASGRGELPFEAVNACLALAGVDAAQVDCVAIVRPLPARGDHFHLQVRGRFPNSRILLVEHHVAHAAAAYYPSGFDRATVLTLDRQGDFRCATRWQAEGSRLLLERESYYPDSVGELYSRVTELLGFHPGSEEHKTQWLSVEGEPDLAPLFREIMPLHDGWPQLDRSFFQSDRLTHGGFASKFYARLGVEDNAPLADKLRARVAAGMQRALEDTVVAMAGSGENLCIGGGVALNALLIAALERSGFKNVFVQPASGNAGTAVGAVLEAWHNAYQQTTRASMGNVCLGPAFSAEEIKKVIENCKLRFQYLVTTDELIDTAIAQLAENKIVAWMHGRMEFGPRALGNRSILASPLDPYSGENLNAFIKHREAFRKFAASVPEELAGEYFEVGPNARFLATAGTVRPAHRDKFASATMKGGIARVHLVRREDNPLYWRLLHAAGKKTGLPVLYNTSFNLFGEPLVCNPRDAVRSFFSSGIDAMFVGNFFLQK